MFSQEAIDKAKELEEKWQSRCSDLYKGKEFKATTRSGIPLKPVYSLADIADIDYEEIGIPGEYPYTRGIYPLQYQFQPWVMQQLHGYGLPEQTNERMKLLIKEGMTGYGRPYINLPVDPPTFIGYDPDEIESRGKVGLCGSSVCTIEDVDKLFQDIPLDKVNIGWAVRNSAFVLTAMLIALAEERGIPKESLMGNTLNILYDRAFCGGLGFPPHSTFIVLEETVKYCVKYMPLWGPVGLGGYNVADSGSSPTQETAVTLSLAITLAEMCIEAGLKPDDFLPRFSFAMWLSPDFFEEIVKMRAMRKMWAKIAKERFKAQNPKSMQLRTRMQTGGATLTAQQPLNNIVRITLQALSGILAGTNALHTNGYDEPLWLPGEESAILAIRTQQIILHETGVANVSDPMAGSYYVEWLTKKFEEETNKILADMDKGGGYIKCWETGWIWEMVEQEAYKRHKRVADGEEVVVGLNKYVSTKQQEMPAFKVDPETEKTAIERVKKFRENRDQGRAKKALDNLRDVADKISKGGWKTELSLIEALVEAAKGRATLGEMMGVLRDTLGWNSAFEVIK